MCSEQGRFSSFKGSHTSYDSEDDVTEAEVESGARFSFPLYPDLVGHNCCGNMHSPIS